MARRISVFVALTFVCFAGSTPACSEPDEDEFGEGDEDDDIHFRPARPTCPNCGFHSVGYTVSSGQLQGGTISTARMYTSVTHSTCPYSGYNSPCTMNVNFGVKCKTPGAGTFQISYSPNGYSTGATGSGSVQVTVALPSGGVSTFSVPATFGTPTTTVAPSTPCGDTEVWSIID